MRPIFFLSSLFLSIPAIAQQPITSHFKIYDTRNEKIISIEQIAIDMKDADVLFFGEEHNDSAGHWLENEIFRALHRVHGSAVALSLEMFETDCQLILDEYLDGHISEERFRREGRAWTNYKDYRAAVEYAKENRLHVIAANTPRRYVNMVSRKGMRSLDSLPKASKKYLPQLPFDTATGAYRDKFMGFMSGGSPGTENPRIFYSQNLWDAGMANSIYQFWKKNKSKKIFHLVGRFHSDEKLGTVSQLQNLRSNLKIRNISCFSDSTFSNPDWQKFKSLGDYVIITDPELKKTF